MGVKVAMVLVTAEGAVPGPVQLGRIDGDKDLHRLSRSFFKREEEDVVDGGGLT